MKTRCPYGQGWITFEQLVAIETDECVLWPWGTNSKGYGLVQAPGSRVPTTVSALACGRRNGPKPSSEAEAAHSCRNRHCMNYRHLRWATPAENQADRLRDGTSNRGSRHGLAKLTEEDVRTIRRRVAGGELQVAVCSEFRVSKMTVSRIVNRQTWGWLE